MRRASMKKGYRKFIRQFTTGLVTASLAVPLVASAAINPALLNGGGGGLFGGGVSGPGPGGGIFIPVPVDTPTIQATSATHLVQLLNNPNVTGRIIIPWFAQWDLSGYKWIPLRSGIQLIGERGPLGSRPL